MTKSLPYAVGRFIARRPGTTAFALIATVVASLMLFARHEDPVPGAVRIDNAISTQAKDNPRAACRRERASRLMQYQTSLAAGEPWKAATALRSCATTLQDGELLALVAVAERQDALTIARDAKVKPRERQRAIDRVQPTDPQDAAELAKLRKTIAVAVEKVDEAELRATAARKRSEGARIGMTPDEVRASSWGKPERVNRSVYSFGVHEQWVYGGRNYLYFQDGVLNSIQTGN